MQEKLKKIELNEEFIAMCRGEEQNLWNVISPFYRDKNEKDMKRMSGKFQISAKYFFSLPGDFC